MYNKKDRRKHLGNYKKGGKISGVLVKGKERRVLWCGSLQFSLQKYTGTATIAAVTKKLRQRDMSECVCVCVSECVQTLQFYFK